jgi:hypothetical protein
VRRIILWLVLVGGAALLVSWPLWHVVRPDSSGCGAGPCDPRLILPFGSLATALTFVGGVALTIAVMLVVALAIRGVIRLDARERQAGRE